MPWQRLVADTALEVDPRTGRLAYRLVIVTVPRQSGKSTLANAVATHRLNAPGWFGPRQRVAYTAQTRNDARKKWIEDYLPDLEASPYFGPRLRKSLANGSEGHDFPATGGRFAVLATGDTSGHGGTLDLAHVDEAFALVDDRLDQALGPAMITRPQPQQWIWSTRGWAGESPYLEAHLEAAYAAVDADLGAGVALFDWHAPAHLDADDPDTWAVAMPALGYTVTLEAVAAERQKMSAAGFARAYLNRPDVPRPTIAGDLALDVEAWDGLAGRHERPGTVALAVTVSPTREWSTISLAGRVGDGLAVLQVIKSGRGTRWVADEVAEFARKHQPTAIVYDGRTDAAGLAGAYEARRIRPKPRALLVRDVALAARGLAEAVTTGTVGHYGQELLGRAVMHARRKPAAGLWEIGPPPASSEAGSVDVSPLVGVSLALAALEAAPTTPPRAASILTGAIAPEAVAPQATTTEAVRPRIQAVSRKAPR